MIQTESTLRDPSELTPTPKPVLPKPGSGSTPIDPTVATYENTIRFYADKACTQPIALTHDIVFTYYLNYAITRDGKVWCEADKGTQMIVRKGQSTVTLPKTSKTRVFGVGAGNSIVQTIRDPYYTLYYPENECKQYDPYN